MSKHKRGKAERIHAPMPLPSGVVSRLVKGVKEGAPEREALARLRRELEVLPSKGEIAKATVVFCGQGRGCLMVSLSASGRHQENFIAGTPQRPVPLENIQITEVSTRGVLADFSNS